jgi:hypothetical protein
LRERLDSPEQLATGMWWQQLWVVAYDVLSTYGIAFYFGYMLASMLGLGMNQPYFYCYHLMDIVVMNEPLKDVVRAVTEPAEQLTLTLVLGMFVIYTFAVMGFFFLPGDFWNSVPPTNHADSARSHVARVHCVRSHCVRSHCVRLALLHTHAHALLSTHSSMFHHTTLLHTPVLLRAHSCRLFARCHSLFAR